MYERIQMHWNIHVRNATEKIVRKGKIMKIELIRQEFDGSVSYKYKPFQYCCDSLKNNPCVEFTNETYDDEHIPVFVLVKHEVVTDWEDEYEQDIYYKIDFCPFCGEPIEISAIGEEEDVDDIFQDLRKQREELWKKYNRTDSKKKAQELYNKVHELDNQIDWFYQLVEYKDIRLEGE